MPPRPKPSAEQKKDQESAAIPDESVKTVYDQSLHVYNQAHPYAPALADRGPSGLETTARSLWTNAYFARTPAALRCLSAKAQRDVWRVVNEADGLPLRAVPPVRPTASADAPAARDSTGGGSAGQDGFTWGRDRFGADLGDLTLDQFDTRAERALQLTALEIQSTAFLEKREREKERWLDPQTNDLVVLTTDEIQEEKLRRREIARLKMDLYGQRTGAYAKDPVWDDVVPMPIEDPENALAAIAYPEEYAEAISYLRAVMAKGEYSRRCLRLTEHIISLNPAHYTVWLYRFSVVQGIKAPITEEIKWLNDTSFEHMKNYQIWHHRRLLMDYYYPSVESDPEKKAELGRSEQEFLAQILAEDAKNYHAWSYRQYLVPKLGLFGRAELEAAEALIDEDVRNNSAWSHRFFLVFSDPANSNPDSLATEHDPTVPAELIEREVNYAKDKILLAPQNQSPWNYLRGVLAKGGRKVGTLLDFVTRFATDVGIEESEKVSSSHALEVLADIYAENGDKDQADLCLRRLGEKWDRIRLGYWNWKRALLMNTQAAA